MRRILRKIASQEVDQLGDTSTLADPSVVDQLIDGEAEKKRIIMSKLILLILISLVFSGYANWDGNWPNR